MAAPGTWVIAAAILAGSLITSALVSRLILSDAVAEGVNSPLAATDMTTSLGGALMPYVVVLLGSASVTSEFASRVAGTLYTATPHHWPMLGAKAIVIGAWGAIAQLVAWLAGYVVAMQPLQAANRLAPLDHPSLAATLWGRVTCSFLLAAIGVAIGALLKRSTVATGAVLVLFVVVPICFGTLTPLASSLSTLASLMPLATTNQIISLHEVAAAPHALGPQPLVSYAALSLWAVSLMVGASWRLRHADL